MPGYVDHIVDPTEDPEVAICRLDGAVAREVGPVAPVLALLVTAVLLVVDLHEALGLAPDRLEGAGPRIADADVARAAASGLYHLAVFVVDYGVDPEDPRAAASGLHRLKRGQGAAQETTILGLPPGVDDGRLALAHDIVVPAPDGWLDRLAHRRHVLEVVVVLLWLVRTELAEHADRRGRGVEDVHPEPLGDAPGTSRIRIRRDPLVHHARRAERQGPVHDVGVPGDPADVGETPVRVLGVDVLVVLRRTGDVGQVSPRAVLGPLRWPGRPAGVHEEQGRLGRHGHRLDYCSTIIFQEFVHEEVAAGHHGALRCVLARVPAPHQHLVDLDAELTSPGQRLVGLGLVVDQFAVAVVAVHRHQGVTLGVGDPLAARCTAESPEHLVVDDAETGAGEHRDGQLCNHR